jgi:excisionase family DNA binding protein
MTETPEQDEVLTYPEAAALLKVHVRTLARLVANGEVPYSRVGGSVRFSRTALHDHVAGRTRAPYLPVAASEKV